MYYKLIYDTQQWFRDKGIAHKDGSGQLNKLDEELAELKSAETTLEEIDAIGDVAVVLIGYCLQKHYAIERLINNTRIFFEIDKNDLIRLLEDGANNLRIMHQDESNNRLTIELTINHLFSTLHAYCFVRNYNF